MKSLFPGYYRPTEVQFSELWKEAIFVFDTNTLLNLYRYPQTSREMMLKVMDQIKNRIWIPYQVAMEYHKHLHDEIYNQRKAYENIELKFRTSLNQLIKELNDLRHSNIDVNTMIDSLEESKRIIQLQLEKQKEQQPDLHEIKDKISSIISSNVGASYNEEQLSDIYEKGETRYKGKIPPGYNDEKGKKDKESYFNGLKYKDMYGDLVYWFQILDYSKEDKVKSIILVTDDSKEWLPRVKGETRGPDPELMNEFNRESGGKPFYVYQTEQFLKYSISYLFNKHGLDSEIVDGAILEIEEFIKQEENTVIAAKESSVTLSNKIKNVLSNHALEARKEYSYEVVISTESYIDYKDVHTIANFISSYIRHITKERYFRLNDIELLDPKEYPNFTYILKYDSLEMLTLPDDIVENLDFLSEGLLPTKKYNIVRVTMNL